MIRDKKREQKERVAIKTLDRAFIKEIEEGLNCSPFESKAILEVVKEVYFPWIDSYEAIRPGRMMIMGISIDEPAGKPLKDCRFGTALVTYDAGEEDEKIRGKNGRKGIAMLRRHRLLRIAKEAREQGILLTLEDFAYKIFNCGYRTLCRDLEYLRSEGCDVPLRSQQKDIGRALSHRVKAVELYIQRKTYSQISRQMAHSMESIKNYITKFVRVVALTELRYSVAEIGFVVQISSYLVRKYQGLYKEYKDNSKYRDRLEEIMEEFSVKKNLKDLLKRGVLEE